MKASYLSVFGCTGSSLLLAGCGAWASRGGGFSWWWLLFGRAQALPVGFSGCSAWAPPTAYSTAGKWKNSFKLLRTQR